MGSHKETSDTAWINVPAKYLRQHYVVFVLIDNSCITLKSFLTSLLPWGTFSECFIYNQMHIISLCKAVLKVQFHKVSLFFLSQTFFPLLLPPLFFVPAFVLYSKMACAACCTSWCIHFISNSDCLLSLSVV